MEMREQPPLLRRGAAPPDERTSAIFIAASCLLHAMLLAFFVMKARPSLEIALPASAGGPRTRTQLVRITPLRTFPSPEASSVAEPAATRPKPALIKRYTPGAKVVVRTERGAAKKGVSDEAKSQPREVAPAPQADLTPRWFSTDSTRSVSAAVEGDFKWAYYLAAIRNKIGSHWVPPPGLDAQGRQVRATLYFRISKDGQISVAQIESSSGMAFFDQTAMRALLAATPLPPLPAGFDDNYLGVHFGFEYQQ